MIDERLIDKYLARIDAARPDRPDVVSLAALQLAHLLRVPFENLDIRYGVPIVLEPAAIIDKVIGRVRGGYCYELNSAFGGLLMALGYDVDLVAARVARNGGTFGMDFAHMALLVRAVDQPEPLLVDVGFGDGFTIPIPLTEAREAPDRDRMVRLIRDGSEWTYQENKGEGWNSRYAFTERPRRLREFSAMNEWQQTAPESHFTTQTICSLLTVEGRTTIADNRLIITRDGARNERQLQAGEMDAVLRDRFGIQLRDRS